MKKIYLTLTLCLTVASFLYSQNLTVTGTVVDTQNQPLVGVSIVVKGTTRGTTTDFDGNYQISADVGETLIFSYIGFDVKEVSVNSEFINVTLEEGAQALENVVVIGSRNANRTATDTPVPVDIIDVAQLTSSAPQVTINEILNYAAPSFSSNTQTISDGTDHIDPASLRGLGPDQVLVLINGKRRHKTSLVNVNGTFGRGSVGTDMNSIPSNAIERIEILRDGAAAQYGSDAIAGVINIVLKKSVNQLNVAMYSGANFTSEAGPDRSVDGEKVNLDLNYGLPIGEDGGYINFSGTFGFRGHTNRMQQWEGSIFNGLNSVERAAAAAGENISDLYNDAALIQLYATGNSALTAGQIATVNGASLDELQDLNGLVGSQRLFGDDYDYSVFSADAVNYFNNNMRDHFNTLSYTTAQQVMDLEDLFNTANADGSVSQDEFNELLSLMNVNAPLAFNNTDAELAAREQQRSDYNMRVGQSRLRNAQFFANMSIPVGEDLELYGFGGLGYRTGNSAGFYRLPNQSRTYTPAYLNGFLPEINSNITDKSAAFGIRGNINGWNVDFSNTWGKNAFSYRITNSNNASLGNSTPFEAYAGGFSYNENTTNFDMNKFFEDTFEGLNIAFGAEYRLENYQIFAGSENSYAQYNTSGNVHDPTNPASIVPTDFFGRSRPGGIQVFPGFRPDNEVDDFRNSIAAYFDVEADFTENVLATAAIRYENYSDFGGTLNGKLAMRVKASDNLNIRGGLQTGFRAPSLHQINFNSTSTLFVDGIPNEVGIFPNTSRVARILGIEPLKEETSLGVTAGFTAKVPSANLKITLDGYITNIKDRVILTGQFTDNDDPELALLFAQANAERVGFFANAVDTKTSGVDVVVDHKMFFGESNGMNLTNTLAFTFSQTEVDAVKVPEAIESAGLAGTYFDQTSRIYLESAVPTTKGSLSHLFELDKKWNFFLRNAYFGEVEEATNNIDPDVDRIYAGKIVTDLSVGYNFSDNTRITVGANNLLDVYSDLADPAFQSSGRFLYSRRSQQFGTNGRHIFARINLKL